VVNVGDDGDITKCAFSHVKLLKLRIRLINEWVNVVNVQKRSSA